MRGGGARAPAARLAARRANRGGHPHFCIEGRSTRWTLHYLFSAHVCCANRHAPTSARSIDFCVIWVCISSSSGSWPLRGISWTSFSRRCVTWIPGFNVTSFVFASEKKLSGSRPGKHVLPRGFVSPRRDLNFPATPTLKFLCFPFSRMGIYIKFGRGPLFLPSGSLPDLLGGVLSPHGVLLVGHDFSAPPPPLRPF